jgi:hypothetical protein
MYAAHFAAAMTVKSRVPTAPTGALLIGAFLPDLFWIPLARVGVEPAQPAIFFDDWSHSLLSVLLMATAFAVVFWKHGQAVVAAAWVAVFSHFLLDFPVHPKRLALYPRSSVHLGWDLVDWGLRPGWLGVYNDWWLQLSVLLVLLTVYAVGMRATRIPASLVWASCVVLVSAQLLMLVPGIGY